MQLDAHSIWCAVAQMMCIFICKVNAKEGQCKAVSVNKQLTEGWSLGPWTPLWAAGTAERVFGCIWVGMCEGWRGGVPGLSQL